MFDQYNDLNNYMTYDSSSLNQYNYANLNTALPIYQQYENLYHFTRQINPITLSNVSPQSRDPSNIQSDMRPTIYDGVDGVYGNHSMNDITQHQSRVNNPNNWRDLITSKPGYYDQNEHTNNYYRPKSVIQAGIASSNQDINGYLLF